MGTQAEALTFRTTCGYIPETRYKALLVPKEKGTKPHAEQIYYFIPVTKSSFELVVDVCEIRISSCGGGFCHQRLKWGFVAYNSGCHFSSLENGHLKHFNCSNLQILLRTFARK